MGLKGKDAYPLKHDFVVHPGADPSQIRIKLKWADPHLLSQGKKLKKGTPLFEFEEGELKTFTNDNQLVDAIFKVNDRDVWFDIGKYDKNKTLVIDPPLGLVWGTYFGGNLNEKNTDVWSAIDANGNVFITSNTHSFSNFPTVNPGGGAYFVATNSGPNILQGKGGDVCIFKFNNAGALVWCTFYGGSGHDNGCSVAVNSANEVFVVGSTLSTNFPLMNWAGAYNQSTYQGGFSSVFEGGDAFILKFSNNGNLLWGTYFGGSANEVARAVEVDALGNIFVGGWTESSNFPLLNPGNNAYYQSTIGGQKDIFISKFSPTGTQLWTTYYGGSGEDLAYSIFISGTNLFLTGQTSSTNFPTLNPGGGAYFQATIGGNSDAFLIKMNTSAVNIWATFLGGNNKDVGYDITLNGSGDIFMIGYTQSSNFPVINPGGGAYFDGTLSGSSDAFVARFGSTGNQIWTTYLGGSADEEGRAIITDNCGNVYVTGNTFSIDLPVINPGGGAYFASYQNLDDVFIGAFNFMNSLVWLTYDGTIGFDEMGTCLAINPTTNHLYIVGYWCFFSVSTGYQPMTGAYNKSNTNGDDFFILKVELAPCNSVSSISAQLCYGTSTVLSFPGFITLTNPVYSIQPGGQTQTSPQFTINPSQNSTYTLYLTGQDSNSVQVSYSVIANVSVLPSPTGQAQVFNGTCANPTNSVNIPVNFLPSGNLNYSVSWSPQPQSFSSQNTATASGLTAGPNSATITASNGCQLVVPFTVAPTPQAASFVIVPTNMTITCSNSVVPLTASVTNGVPLSFTWSGCPPGNITGSVATFSTPCTGNVIGTSSTGCSNSQTFQILQDMNLPGISVNPSVVTINCIPMFPPHLQAPVLKV